MAPVGVGTSAQASLSNAMVNGYGALSPGDLETVIAYGAANGSGNSSYSNNPATTNGTAALITFIQANSTGGAGATNITVTGVVSGNSGITATVPATFSTAGSNYIVAIAAQTTNGLATFAYVNTASNQNAAALLATNNLLISDINTASNRNAASIIATNTLAIAYINVASNQNAMANIASNAAAIAYVNVASNQNASAIITSNNLLLSAISAATNGLAPTVANNSYTTNFFFPNYKTNLVFVLPPVSTNYLVSDQLLLVARAAAPGMGIGIASGATLKAIDAWGATYSCKPFNLNQSVDGTAFDFSASGDNQVSLLDTNGAAYTLTAQNMTNAFSLRAVFTWTIHK